MHVVAVIVRIAVGVLGPGLYIAVLVVPIALIVLVRLGHVKETCQRLPLILVVSFHDVLVAIDPIRQVLWLTAVVGARLGHVRRLVAVPTWMVLSNRIVGVGWQHGEMHMPGALIVTEAVQGIRGTMHGSINRDRHVVLVTRVDILISI